MDITPEKELKIIKVVAVRRGRRHSLFLDIPENFIVSLTLLRVRPDHPLYDRITAYQKKRIRSIFRSRGLSPRRAIREMLMSRLTEKEQQEIIRYIEADKPLPR